MHRRAWPGVAAWGLWGLAVVGVATIPWFDHLLRQAGRPDLTQLNASTVPLVLAALVAASVGAVLASRRPRHPVGWLLLGLGLTVTASGVFDGYARYGLVVRPGSLPLARWVAVYSPATLYLGFVFVGWILLLTPTGSPPSPRWRWWARLSAAAPAAFLLALAVGPGLVIPPYDTVIDPVTVPALTGLVDAAIAVGVAHAIVGLVAGAWSLVVRFRRARGVEREQLRWVAFAAALTVPLGAVVVTGVAMDVFAGAIPSLATGGCLALLPLATGAAILRYRLYDLDRIVSRTLAYGLLTVLLGLGYATLVRRVQATVDRRFNRRRHDAGRVIDAFAARLRDQVDLDALHSELLAVVDQTMQPTRASLWLRTTRPPAGWSSSTAPTSPSWPAGWPPPRPTRSSTSR
jgi:hypothetical protein